MSKPDTAPGQGKPPAVTEGAQQEFAQQFSRSFPVLWTIAAGITGNRTRADNVVQDAALIGVDKFDQFQPGSSFTTWMAPMVRSVALNAMRKEQQAGDARTNADVRDVAQEKPLEDQPQFDDAMMRAVGEVGEAARACLLLRTLHGMDYSEISALLGIPQAAAMTHVHRARDFLRRHLGGAKPTAGPA